MNKLMSDLCVEPLKVYKKTGWTDAFDEHDSLILFRIRNIKGNIPPQRKDIFHTPYNLRSKVPSCRYSISGYPSLYLSTSLALCNEEVKKNNSKESTIASRFKIERNNRYNDNINIDVVELALKFKDFTGDQDYPRDNHYINKKRVISRLSDDIDIMGRYLYWYPLIAACSFIRTNKSDPFASEYIIPQLLMQWIRSRSKARSLIGIRYFSCESKRSSDMGFNYVFPVSGDKYGKDKNFCKVLSNSFKLTTPIYLHDFASTNECEDNLKRRRDADFNFI